MVITLESGCLLRRCGTGSMSERRSSNERATLGSLINSKSRPGTLAESSAIAFENCRSLGDASTYCHGRLPHLDQVAIRVSDVGADLPAMVLRLGEKLRAFGRPVFVGLLNIRDPDVEEGAGAVRVGRGGQGHGWLVIRRPAADVQDEPGVGDLHDHWIALDEHLAIEDPLVEVTGTILVRDDQEVGDYEAIFWCRKVIWVHIGPPFAFET